MKERSRGGKCVVEQAIARVHNGKVLIDDVQRKK